MVIAIGREECGLGVLFLLRCPDVADVDKLVVPGVERNDFERIVLGVASGYRAGLRIVCQQIRGAFRSQFCGRQSVNAVLIAIAFASQSVLVSL